MFLSMMIDDATTALGGNRHSAREECLRYLNTTDGEAPEGVDAPNPDTWGLEPEHQAGLMSAMDSFIAPAGVG